MNTEEAQTLLTEFETALPQLKLGNAVTVPSEEWANGSTTIITALTWTDLKKFGVELKRLRAFIHAQTQVDTLQNIINRQGKTGQKHTFDTPAGRRAVEDVDFTEVMKWLAYWQKRAEPLDPEVNPIPYTTPSRFALAEFNRI